MEAAGPGKTLPSKVELLTFQARWMRPAGISAILGALIIAISLPIQPSVSGDNDADRLTKFHDNSTGLVVGQGILIGIGLLLFIPLLYVLIRSVVGRTKRVRRGMVSLAFVGPILFSVSGLLVALGLDDAAGNFVEQAPAKERQARDQAVAAQAAAPKRAAGPSKQAGGGTSTAPLATPNSPTTTSGSTTTGTTTAPLSPDQAVSKARDDLANDVIDDSSLLRVGSFVRFIGLIAFVFAMIYIPLWCMRTGLLTRFWAVLGIALGVSIVLVPVGIFGLVLWFAVIGLMLARWWPVSLPPAWDAAEAIPWPRPGEDIGPPLEERGGPGTVEGSGREVSEEPPAENGGGRESAQPPETQGQRRKKRKRRK